MGEEKQLDLEGEPVPEVTVREETKKSKVYAGSLCYIRTTDEALLKAKNSDKDKAWEKWIQQKIRVKKDIVLKAGDWDAEYDAIKDFLEK